MSVGMILVAGKTITQAKASQELRARARESGSRSSGHDCC
jgi:hypothetical protein